MAQLDNPFLTRTAKREYPRKIQLTSILFSDIVPNAVYLTFLQFKVDDTLMQWHLASLTRRCKTHILLSILDCR